MGPQEVLDFCPVDSDGQEILNSAILRFGFSPRAVSSCIKVARTIADIAGSKDIKSEHITEAVEFRKLCNDLVPEL